LLIAFEIIAAICVTDVLHWLFLFAKILKLNCLQTI